MGILMQGDFCQCGSPRTGAPVPHSPHEHSGRLNISQLLNWQGLGLEQMRIFSKDLIWTPLSPCYPSCFLLLFPGIIRVHFFPRLFLLQATVASQIPVLQQGGRKTQGKWDRALLTAFGTHFPPHLGEELFLHPAWWCFLPKSCVVWGHLSAPM